MASNLLFGVGGLAIFIVATGLFDCATQGRPIPWPGLVGPSVIAICALAGGRINRRWSQSLPHYTAKTNRTRFTIREMLIALTVICAMTAMVRQFVLSNPPRYAEHVDITRAPFGLPAAASDISFCQGYRGTIAYEFTIDETSFREWVAQGIGSFESNASDVRLEPISAPVPIRRYNFLSTDLSGPDSVTVKRGLSYSWSFEDRGVYAVFDSTTGRAYYFAHFH